MANQAASKTIRNAATSCSDGSTNIPPTFTTSQASNHHHTASHNIQCSPSPVINDVSIMANSNQQMSLLPNLTDAILETDIFYPLVSFFQQECVISNLFNLELSSSIYQQSYVCSFAGKVKCYICEIPLISQTRITNIKQPTQLKGDTISKQCCGSAIFTHFKFLLN